MPFAVWWTTGSVMNETAVSDASRRLRHYDLTAIWINKDYLDVLARIDGVLGKQLHNLSGRRLAIVVCRMQIYVGGKDKGAAVSALPFDHCYKN